MIDLKRFSIRRQKYINAITFFITVLGIAGLVAAPDRTSDAAADGISVCLNTVVPSLFPFFVFSSLFIGLGFAQKIGRRTEWLMRPLFHVNGACSGIFVLGLISGFPVGAKTAVKLYQSGGCSKVEAERMLAFCNNAGPAFVLGTVGMGIWNSPSAGWILLSSQIAASVLTGILFSRIWRSSSQDRFSPAVLSQPKQERRPFFSVFVSSVRDAAVSMVYICAFIIFFAVIISMLQGFGIIPALAKGICAIFPFDLQTVENALAGVFEMTTGVRMVGNAAPVIRSLTLTGAILGWAGFSVHCQVLTFVYESGLSTAPYFWGKILQTVFSGLFTFLLSWLFHLDSVQTLSQAVPAFSSSFVFSYRYMLFSVCIGVALMCFGSLFVLLVQNRKN